MNPYREFVSNYARLARDGRNFPLGGFAPLPRPALPDDAPKALIFSPHPDDECIIGGLALRLMREARMRIINVAVTQGSNKERQSERWRELQAACDYIGFGLQATGPCGLEKVTVKTRQDEVRTWLGMVDVIARVLDEHQPRVVLFPHERDWNSAHIGTHFLVMDALRQMPGDFTCYAVETEFWGAMDSPNLMVELSEEDLADMIAALTFHVGEVKRNPYHVLLPAWMMDNVRRGAELVGGQGGAAPDFTFATLYRLRRWSQGAIANTYEGGKQLPANASAATLFP
jgi:LmbE family N-acetylglucosaminyl deacetylase